MQGFIIEQKLDFYLEKEQINIFKNQIISQKLENKKKKLDCFRGEMMNERKA